MKHSSKLQKDNGIVELLGLDQILATDHPKFPHLSNSQWFDSNVAVAWVRVTQFPNVLIFTSGKGIFVLTVDPGGAFKDSILRPGGPPEPWLNAEV